MGSWMQETRVSVNPKTGKETKTVMPKKKYKQESISREEFNDDNPKSGSWMQETRVSVDPKTGKETKTVMPKKEFKQESISREEFNDAKSMDRKRKAAILQAKIEAQKKKSEEDEELGAPYRKQTGPRENAR